MKNSKRLVLFLAALTLLSLVVFQVLKIQKVAPVRDMCAEKFRVGAEFSVVQFAAIGREFEDMIAAFEIGEQKFFGPLFREDGLTINREETDAALVSLDANQHKLTGTASASRQFGSAKFTCKLAFTEGRITSAESAWSD